ncbi:MAG: DMT family transporter [Acidiferrobacterales bacterium]|nr:DMT family transporter [Acidiferrobacterales bacterium]
MFVGDKAKGYLITMLGVIAISPDGLLTRFISADSMTITFWRGLLFGLTVLMFVVLRYRSRTLAVFARFTLPDAGIVACYCVGNILFIYSITHTTVANTLFMLSTTPIWAALVSLLFLREKMPRRTIVAILAVVVGIVVITQGSEPGSGDWLGILAGLLAAATLATQFSLIRLSSTKDILPSLGLGGVFTALVMAPLVAPAETSNLDLTYLIIMGVLMLPLANALMFVGPKYLPAPEVGLMMLLETILGPIWVWLVLSENPGWYSIIGGAIVLMTLIINTWLALREEYGIRSFEHVSRAGIAPKQFENTS